MDIAEIKRDVCFKFESILGSFLFIDDKVNELKMQIICHENKEREFVHFLLDLRKELREKKDFLMADKIRDQLQNIGVKIEDQKTQLPSV